MSKKNHLITITLVFLSVIIAFSFFYIEHRKLNHISCNAFYIAKSAEARLVTKNHMEIDDEVGSWMMNGRVKVDDKDVHYFKLRTQFSVKRIGNIYYFTTNNVLFSPSESANLSVLNEFLADVLRIENTQSFFTIKPVKGSYIIFSGDIPIMYCMSTNS